MLRVAQTVGGPETQRQGRLLRGGLLQNCRREVRPRPLFQAERRGNAMPGALHGADPYRSGPNVLGGVGGLAGVDQQRHAVHGNHHGADVAVVVVLAVVSALGGERAAQRMNPRFAGPP